MISFDSSSSFRCCDGFEKLILVVVHRNESDWSFERVFQTSQETIEILNLENARSSYSVFDICRGADSFCFNCWFDCNFH